MTPTQCSGIMFQFRWLFLPRSRTLCPLQTSIVKLFYAVPRFLSHRRWRRRPFLNRLYIRLGLNNKMWYCFIIKIFQNCSVFGEAKSIVNAHFVKHLLLMRKLELEKYDHYYPCKKTHNNVSFIMACIEEFYFDNIQDLSSNTHGDAINRDPLLP